MFHYDLHNCVNHHGIVAGHHHKLNLTLSLVAPVGSSKSITVGKRTELNPLSNSAIASTTSVTALPLIVDGRFAISPTSVASSLNSTLHSSKVKLWCVTICHYFLSISCINRDLISCISHFRLFISLTASLN